jgi:hypothetical protein
VEYEQVISFYEEIGFFPPVKYFPGVIGGHCVMPNIRILRQKFSSDILAAIVHSNEMKEQLMAGEQISSPKRPSRSTPAPTEK